MSKGTFDFWATLLQLIFYLFKVLYLEERYLDFASHHSGLTLKGVCIMYTYSKKNLKLISLSK